jgi:hypothetical protein
MIVSRASVMSSVSSRADGQGWGIVMTLMGIVQNYTGLLVARIFLGITEGE